MKRITLLLVLVLILGLGACKLPQPGSVLPTAIPTDTGLAVQAAATGTATKQAAGVQAGEPESDKPTITPPPVITETKPPAAAAALTDTPVPPAEQGPTATPEAPASTPTKTLKPAVRFDPYTAYGNPKYLSDSPAVDKSEWAQAQTGVLPDNTDIKLQGKDGKLYVTGKMLDYSTWWFTYHSLKDFYLEMTFDTENCSDSDAYGMILRGPEHLSGVSYGYVVAFNCKGEYWAFRLDGIDPWEVEELVNETASDYVRAGSDKQNVIGVRAVGDTITIVANGYEIAQFKDDEYSAGRYGVFVRASSTSNYTYRLTKIAYWDLVKKK